MLGPNRSIYLAILALYVLTWLLIVIGLATAQHHCKENTSLFARFMGSDFLATRYGSGCHRFFRLPWTICFLGLLPLIMEGLSITRKSAAGTRRVGGSAPLFAVMATLNILMAHAFYNYSELSGEDSKLSHRMKTTLAGFAITAALALLLLVMSPLTGDKQDGPDMKSFTTINDANKVEGTPATTTAGARPIATSRPVVATMV